MTEFGNISCCEKMYLNLVDEPLQRPYPTKIKLLHVFEHSFKT